MKIEMSFINIEIEGFTEFRGIGTLDLPES
jgi:hypothetical protein